MKNIMLNTMRNLLGSLSSETPQINHGLLLGKYLLSQAAEATESADVTEMLLQTGKETYL